MCFKGLNLALSKIAINRQCKAPKPSLNFNWLMLTTYFADFIKQPAYDG